ncbi:MAG TPA: PQQ-binding-like beta-propeller repeat protein [Candidatus Baltobacteraceae bacterium]|jgi:outer membrane protein assembly factor BamB|nr:PQQ-binding-like beta-propeller repeat protein [Candidatus Baltobacteraceae bacterium]
MTSFKGKLLCFFASLVFSTAAGACAQGLGPSEWTQFRLNAQNNAVVPGNLSATWFVRTGGPISASPTIVDGTIYIGNNAGWLYALDAASGSVKWRFRVSDPLMSAPLVYNDLVIVGEGNEQSVGPTPSAPLYVGTNTNALLAFERTTGTLRWRTLLPGSGMPTPAIVNGVLVHHNGAGWVTALDPATGRKLYARDLHSIASMVAALPIGTDRFITSGVVDNAVWELKASDGSTVWKTAFNPVDSGFGDCPPVTDGKNLFCDYVAPVPPATYTIATTPAIERAFSLDVATGAKRWDVELERGILPERNEAGIPLLANGLLYLGSAIAPYMHAIDPGSGRVIWKWKARGPVKGGVAASADAIYFGDLAGYLWAIDGRTGKVIGDKKMGSGFNVGSPLIVGQTLIIGSRVGTIYAVPTATIRSSHDT